ncbi:phage tail tape measure protein [Endozoicomonas montiporae]|uniref:Phage tail length determinator n=1 Tax=Endozoicomonas montiporae CL-33 TaxID=570277 RepID=A0A142BCS8_9GAMM|nr:phage tail tape measure protein [Endozoicomonas montiporae]AMO56554.1 phage tail length determinator [Endozoicomonas montiporae CL-33]
MATKLEKLMFSISLLDQVTEPAGKIQKTLDSVSQSAKSAFGDIGAGALSMAGAGVAMQQMLMPAIELDRAMGEVASLGVQQNALDQLADTALNFSTSYGKSAAEFVSSAYDIQSAIAGLSGRELSAFTEASGVLAAATKADTATVTNYMGTMYGIFSDTANKMGKAEWVEQVAGMTASAVQMFKTNGNEMSSAFGALGKSATAMGIEMSEQMAILGTMQATMSGSEAATKYKAFLAGVGKAQDALGMSFTDSEGKLLGVMDIMTQLQNRYGDSLTVADTDELAKAFGSSEAVAMVTLLMNQTNALGSSIDQLGKTKGMEQAMLMADAMVDPWEQLSAGINAVRIGFGSALLPVINPLVSKMADGASVLTQWTRTFPNITRWIGYGVLSITAMTAALGAMTLASGIAKIAMMGYGTATAIAMGAINLMKGALVAFRAVMLAVNLVMFANPIGLFVGLVAALSAGIAAAVIDWDKFKASLGDISVFGLLGDAAGWVIRMLNRIPGINIGGEDGASAPTVASLDTPKTSTVPAGGISKTINNAVTNNSNRGGNTVNVTTSQQINSHNIEEMMWQWGG